MNPRIAKAIGEVKRITNDNRVRAVGASIVTDRDLSQQEVGAVVKDATVPGRRLEYRPDMSDDGRTWFDLKAA